MQYLILIHADESSLAALSPDQAGAAMNAYMAYTNGLKEQRKLVQSARLSPIARAKHITVRDNKRRVADGPFADTKEQIGGFFLIDAENDAEAVEIAANCPGAHHGRVELRPLWV